MAGFIFDLRNANQIFRVFLEDLLYQGEIRTRQEKVIQFWFVQFRGEFFYCAEALLKICFFIAGMANLFIDVTFTTVVRIFAKLAFFNYLCSLSGGLTSRF